MKKVEIVAEMGYKKGTESWVRTGRSFGMGRRKGGTNAAGGGGDMYVWRYHAWLCLLTKYFNLKRHTLCWHNTFKNRWGQGLSQNFAFKNDFGIFPI